MRTRMVLHEKEIGFENEEVDLNNKSEEFLRVSPAGKVPVVVADGDTLYESNIVNQYLEEAIGGQRLMPETPKGRAYARLWMDSADDDFYPAVFVVAEGEEKGFSEERIQRYRERLPQALSRLEERLEDRDYLADEFSLADVAHVGHFRTLRSLDEGSDEVALSDYPNVEAWMSRVEARDGYRKAL